MRKMNMHPDMPQPSYGGDSLTNHNMVHGDRNKVAGYRATKQEWERIFGPIQVMDGRKTQLRWKHEDGRKGR